MKYNKYIAGLGFLILVILGIRKLARRLQLKKDLSGAVNRQNLDPGKDYNSLALKLFNVLRGTTQSAEKKGEALNEMYSLNDDEFTHVHNLFNKKYASNCWFCDEYTTFRDWVEGEYEINIADVIRIIDRLNNLELP